jgi:hypothetical protein
MHFRTPTRVLTLAAATAPVCWGWDSLGHQTVGYLAQIFFSAQANVTFNALLGLREEFDIGDAAAWADTVRDRDNLPWSKGWHFISKPFLPSPFSGDTNVGKKIPR